MSKKQAITQTTPILRKGNFVYQLDEAGKQNDWYFQVNVQPRDELREAIIAQKLQELLAVEYNLPMS